MRTQHVIKSTVIMTDDLLYDVEAYAESKGLYILRWGEWSDKYGPLRLAIGKKPFRHHYDDEHEFHNALIITLSQNGDVHVECPKLGLVKDQLRSGVNLDFLTGLVADYFYNASH